MTGPCVENRPSRVSTVPQWVEERLAKDNMGSLESLQSKPGLSSEAGVGQGYSGLLT